jgi:integrase
MSTNDAKTIAELRAELVRLRALLPNALTGKLSASAIAKLKKRGAYSDGGNLWIQVNREGTDGRSWIFRWMDRVTGKYRSIGLGSLRTVSIDKARELALHYRLKLLEGKDPRAERDAEKLEIRIAQQRVKTVSQVANEWFEQKMARKGLRYRNKVFNQINKYVHRTIGDMPIETVDTATILDTVGLRELWTRAFPTARDVIGHLNRMFKFAIRLKYCKHNPAEWEVLRDLLPPREDVYRRQPRPALAYKDVGLFLQAVRSYEDRSYRKTGRMPITYVLEFVVLTGVRISEVLLAQWKEIDRDSMTWNVPPEHRKHGRRTGKVRPVPITKSMLAVLDEMQRRRTDSSPNALVFPSPRTGQAIKTSSPAIFVSATLKWETKITPHGFRSTLRDWMRAETNFKEVFWKSQVDHQLGDGTATDEAYGHDMLLEQRRAMMAFWDDYCGPMPRPEPQAGKVLKLKRRTV